MQILTGELKGRKIKVPRGSRVRPTSSRIKKSIFDTIGNIENGIKVLDVFSGAGGLGLESLSRGAESAVFIEKNKSVAKVLNENIITCGFENKARILGFDYKKALSTLCRKGTHFDIIFIDPPYSLYENKDVEYLVGLSQNLLNENGMIIIEHNSKKDIRSEYFEVKTKKYGETMISYFWRKS